MANDNSITADLNYADTLWKSADALRGQLDWLLAELKTDET